ncbi:MAG: class I SAM-dependent methyltransferase [Pseudomonadota bacterium]
MSKLSPEQIDTALDTYFAEMRFGHQFLAEYLPTGKLRVLEVGAGLGLLSIYLHRLGHDAVALEPAALSFGIFEATKKLIWSKSDNLPHLVEKFAEQLTPEEDGQFDFIFSINVMEHIADIDRATDAILTCLDKSGICVNSCPNYWVPYEPHYAIPMVPFAPGITKRIYSKKISANQEIWDSLNFISHGKVKRMARRNQVSVSFEPGLIFKSFARLGEDTEFLERHKNGLVGRIYRILTATRLLNGLKLLPTALSTPMIFTYRKMGS